MLNIHSKKMLLSSILNDSFGLLSRQLRFYCWHFGRSLNQKHRQELIDLLYGHSFESLANKIKALDTNTINNCKQQVAKLLFEHCLSRNFRSQLIQIIESNLVDLNVRLNNYGHTLLHKSAYDLDVELVRILIQQGVNIRLRDYAGHTALHIAIQSYRNGSSNDVIQNLTEIIRLILEADKKLLNARLLKRKRDEAYNSLMCQPSCHTADCLDSDKQDNISMKSVKLLDDGSIKSSRYGRSESLDSDSETFSINISGQNNNKYNLGNRDNDNDQIPGQHNLDINRIYESTNEPSHDENCLSRRSTNPTIPNHYVQVMKTLKMDGKQKNLFKTSLDSSSNHINLNNHQYNQTKNNDYNNNQYVNRQSLNPTHTHQNCTVDNINSIFLDDYTTPLVNTTNAFGRTALHYCVQIVGQKHLAGLMELLISFGANADAIDRNLRTPLYFLVKSTNITDNQQKLDAINYLLDNGCDDLGLAIRGHEQYFRNKFAKKVTNATTSSNNNHHNNSINNNNDNNDGQQQIQASPQQQNTINNHSSTDPIFTTTTFKRVPNLKHIVRLAMKRNEFNKCKKPLEQIRLELPEECPRSLEFYINKKILCQSEFI